jgi:hypothetical protein
MLHLIVPGFFARWIAGKEWIFAWFIMALTMAVDLDHLAADPIFDPNRCSIGFHPLHTYPAIAVYILLTAFRRTRWIGLGLSIHMALDGLDCMMMGSAGL